MPRAYRRLRYSLTNRRRLWYSEFNLDDWERWMENNHFNHEVKPEKIIPNGCPKCKADLIIGDVFIICANFQHPHIQRYFREGGKRDCDYAMMNG